MSLHQAEEDLITNPWKRTVRLLGRRTSFFSFVSTRCLVLLKSIRNSSSMSCDRGRITLTMRMVQTGIRTAYRTSRQTWAKLTMRIRLIKQFLRGLCQVRGSHDPHGTNAVTDVSLQQMHAPLGHDVFSTIPSKEEFQGKAMHI